MMTMLPNAPDATRAAGCPAAGEPEEDFVTFLRRCDFLQFWRDCTEPACHRARACAGEPGRCFFDRWSRMSETARVWAQAGIDALDHGRSRRAAAQIADRALLVHLCETERLPRYWPRRRLWRRVRGEEGQGTGAGAGV